MIFTIGSLIIALILVFSVLLGEVVMAKDKKEISTVNEHSTTYKLLEKPSDKEIEKVLGLKTEDYKKLFLKDFRNQVAEKLSDSDTYDAFQKIRDYMLENSESLDVDLDELAFLKYTLPCTYGEEIYINVNKKKAPAFYNRINTKFEEESEKGSITKTNCNIEYCVGYSIKDETKFTVEQRDEVIMNVINDMQSYIDTMFEQPISDIDDCYNKLQEKFNEVVSENNTNEMKLSAVYISM